MVLSRDIDSQSTQGGNLVQVFDEKKSKMVNVMCWLSLKNGDIKRGQKLLN